jgi:hypothetical protein
MGWEADRLYRNSVTVTVGTPSHPIIITGYQFKLAMIPSDAPVFPGSKSAQVLWMCGIFGVQELPNDDWGTVSFKDNAGSAQNLHGGAVVNRTLLAVDILKASPWVNAVNDVLTMTGLQILAPPNAVIQMSAAHAGVGPIDFESQGAIYYQLQEPINASLKAVV